MQKNKQIGKFRTKLGKDILPVPEERKTTMEQNIYSVGTRNMAGEKAHNQMYKKERNISNIYPVIDTDLARDNIENDLTASDLQDLEKSN